MVDEPLRSISPDRAPSDRAPSADLTEIVASDVPPAAEPNVQPAAAADSPPWTARFDGQWLPLVWLTGAFSVLIPLATGMLGNLWMVRRGRRMADSALRRLVDRLSADLDLHRDVTLLLLPEGQMPMTFGFLRAFIVLPADALGWTDERLRVVLLHELAQRQAA